MTTPKKTKTTPDHSAATAPATRPTVKSEPQPAVTDTKPFGGVYVLDDARTSAVQRRHIFDNEHVDGVSFRARWRDIEVEPGHYVWDAMDVAIAQAKGARKGVMLRVLPGAYSPSWLRSELSESEIVRYVDDDENFVWMPVPWSEAYLRRWTAFVGAWGRRYRNRSSVWIVAVTGAAEGGEMHLADKSNRALWEGRGYTPERLIAAWNTVHCEFAAAWGQRVLLSQALSTPLTGEWAEPRLVVEAVQHSAEAHGMATQINSLHASMDPEFFCYQKVRRHRGPRGAQTACPWDNELRFGRPIDRAFALAAQAGMTFVEIYPGDLTSDPAALAKLHAQLRAQL